MPILIYFCFAILPTIPQAMGSNTSALLKLHESTSKDLSDLSPLDQHLKKVQIVALGEANHGTAEFFRYKNRLIQYLVSQQGFSLFLIESGYFSCELLNDYVQGKPVDLGEALRDQQYDIWVTTEVAELFVWMRQHNQSAPAHKKIQVSGFDSRDNGRGRDRLKAFLQRVDPHYFKQVEATLDQATLTGFADRETAKVHNQTLEQISLRFKTHQKAWLDKSSPQHFKAAKQALMVLQQAGDYAASDNGAIASDGRDAAMASNVKLLAGKQKTIIWAHNGHVAVGDNRVPDGKSLGHHLRTWLGSGYFTLGFSFFEGSFLAWGTKDGKTGRQAFPTGAPFEGCTGQVLSKWEQGPFLFVLRGLKMIPTTIDRPLLVRWSDGAVNQNYQSLWQQYPLQIQWSQYFDAILHVPNINAAEIYRASN